MSDVDRQLLAHFLRVRRDEMVPGQRAGPVLRLVFEHLPDHPATVFSRFGEVLLQSRPAVALFGDWAGAFAGDPRVRERCLVEVGHPDQQGLRSYRHVELGVLMLHRHQLVDPLDRQLLLVLMAVPGSASHQKLRALVT